MKNNIFATVFLIACSFSSLAAVEYSSRAAPAPGWDVLEPVVACEAAHVGDSGWAISPGSPSNTRLDSFAAALPSDVPPRTEHAPLDRQASMILWCRPRLANRYHRPMVSPSHIWCDRSRVLCIAAQHTRQ